ncbi:ATP-binding protein [Gandjariella thermophila]|uniref:ATPase AAA n=1 Tax=Gandjariella thermophila TaxID=1931992 RepID=A0A4D4JIZ2_9PSEU|nr:DUF499 domain-containing protein [Gandjariella thermophila]GDY33867.1 hypothetical protein GTS_55000 [Gandjariella thermophila]
MTTELTPWTKIAQPHADIADGSFDEGLFAADLGSVARGRGPADYVNPVQFCEKTYLTASLTDVLTRLSRRLSGDESAPSVHRLQTDFGGGKTHTLLSAYHLFRKPDDVAGTALARGLSEQLGGHAIPKATVAVLDGSDLPATPEQVDSDHRLYTLVGHLAWRLGGPTAYDRVAEADRARAGASTHELAELLSAYAPCLVLLDEMLVYLNNALAIETHEGSLAGTTLTIIKNLTQAAAQVPGVAVLATLTSSRMEDYADVSGTEMYERLSRVVGRSENIVTPVEGDDIFPILQRRLFAATGSEEHRRAVADAYGNHYDSLGDVLPSTFREQNYRDRIARAYPFHPELVDLCTHRWGSLSGFQRTRGALRILAHTVKALWRANHDAPLIHLGDLPLYDDAVRGEVLKFAGESYKSALNADIIRPDSKAPQEDQRRGGQAGQMRLATALATTAFANSFSADRVVGASAAQMMIGVTRPGVSRGVLDDVRDALEGALWYMRLEGGRYRFTTEPNLNKVIVEREAAVHGYDVDQRINDAMRKASPSGQGFRVIHNVAEPSALPDDGRLTLGILDPELRLGGDTDSEALEIASQILKTKGAGWRANLNAIVLVAADAHLMSAARSTARTLAAMQDLLGDRYRLARFNAEQKERLRKRASDSEERLPQQIVMAYRHLLALRDANGEGVKVDHSDLGPARMGSTITERVAAHLKDADRLISDQLAPAALLSQRFAVLPADQDAVELDRLLSYFSQYPRLPKLASEKVLSRALASGAESGQFALSSGTSWDAEDALIRFRESVSPDEIVFQPGTWLVRASAAQALLARRQPAGGPDDKETRGEPSGTQAPVVPSGSTPSLPASPTGSGGRAHGGGARGGGRSDHISAVTVSVRGVPGERMREVVKSAVLPLVGAAEVSVDLQIRASGGPQGVPRQTLDLVVKEALRQLGLTDFHVDEHDA